MSRRPPYTRGLHELGDGIHAFLQPDGRWGWSNAGLIVADGASLLIDTLFDLTLTAEMLAAMRPLLARSPLSGAFNTHGNGDHCYGNQLLPEAVPIYATELAAGEIRAVPPVAAHTLSRRPISELSSVAWAREAFGPFDWTGIETRSPTDTFAGERSVHVGGREVRLIAVGPAHTSGDAIAYLPDAAGVFTGDILFAASIPVMWAGPVSSWIAAADLILALEPRVIVPGHGRSRHHRWSATCRSTCASCSASRTSVSRLGWMPSPPPTTSISDRMRPGVTLSGSRSTSRWSTASWIRDAAPSRTGAVRAHGALEGPPSPTGGLTSRTGPLGYTEPEA